MRILFQVFQELISNNSFEPELLNMLLDSNFAAHRPLAITLFEKCLDSTTEKIPILKQLISLAKGDHQRQLKYIRKVLELQNVPEEALLWFAKICWNGALVLGQIESNSRVSTGNSCNL